MIHFQVKKFTELTLNELYDLLALRQEVFVVEQNCPFLDADGKDQQAIHFLGTNEAGALLAYTRLFAPDAYYAGYASIGRVVTSPRGRAKGLGKLLMQESIRQVRALWGAVPIKIGSQTYLDKFYENLGFVPTGETYLEDGIPHRYMILEG